MNKASLPWPTATPADFGWDQRALDGGLVDLLGANQTHSAALVIGGKLVWEHYWGSYGPTSRFNTFSVAKCFASACIGLLIDDGKLKVDDPACKYLPEWSGPTDGRREITIRHLLTMTSGLKLDYEGFWKQPDGTAAALNWPLAHKPGTICCYEQATAMALSPIIKRVSGKQPLAFIKERILDPIGAHEIGWEATPNGDSLTWRSVLASSRDFCRFGQFLLQKGKWEGKQLLSAEFIAQATSHDPLLDTVPSCPQEKPFRRKNWAWMFFVNSDNVWPGVAADSFAMSGAYGNKCLISREHNFVFSRLVTPEGAAYYKPYDNGLGSTDTGTPKIWNALLKDFRK